MLGLERNHNDRLSRKDLSGYKFADYGALNLCGSNFSSFNLQKAILIDANLQDANLQGADLRGAKYLTVKQLSKAKTLYNAELDSELREQIDQHYHHLREPPKPEE